MSHLHPVTMPIQQTRIFQIVILAGVWIAGEFLVRGLHIPIPGSIVGLALLVCAFASGRMKSASVRRGAEFYLGDMLLFFVPAVLAILDHREFLGVLGLKILLVISLGTVVVMLVTAVAVEATLLLMHTKGRTR